MRKRFSAYARFCRHPYQLLFQSVVSSTDLLGVFLSSGDKPDVKVRAFDTDLFASSATFTPAGPAISSAAKTFLPKILRLHVANGIGVFSGGARKVALGTMKKVLRCLRVSARNAWGG